MLIFLLNCSVFFCLFSILGYEALPWGLRAGFWGNEHIFIGQVLGGSVWNVRLYQGKTDVCERLQKARIGGSVEPGDGCNESNESTQGLGEVHTMVGWEAEGRARSGKEKQLFSSCPQSVCVCWFAISCPRLHDSWQKSGLVPMWLKDLHPIFCGKCLSLCCVCVLFLPFLSIFEHLLCSSTDCTRNIEWIT